MCLIIGRPKNYICPVVPFEMKRSAQNVYASRIRTIHCLHVVSHRPKLGKHWIRCTLPLGRRFLSAGNGSRAVASAKEDIHAEDWLPVGNALTESPSCLYQMRTNSSRLPRLVKSCPSSTRIVGSSGFGTPILVNKYGLTN